MIVGNVVVDVSSRSASIGRLALRIGVPIMIGTCIILAFAIAAVAIAKSLVNTVSGLFVALLPLIFVYFIFRFMIVGNFHGERRSGLGRQRGRAGGLVGGLFRAGVGLARGIVGSGNAVSGGLVDASTEVHRFRVDTVSGGRADCEFVGELRGAALRQGDTIRIRGRRNRRGVIVAKRVDVVTTGAVITARPPLPYLIARVGSVLALLLLAAALVLVVRQ